MSTSPKFNGIQKKEQQLKIALLVSDFNFDVTSLMLERARRHAEFLGAEISHLVHVPGVYDMPLIIKRLLARDDVDGVAIIGAVIKGDTKHDELIAGTTASAAVDLALQFNKPVGLGITGPGMDRMQALDRIDNAKNAVESVVQLIKSQKELTS
ncbi:MAG TPA: 6,7-dimethyl-8-ribityllumazine synthase [Candidatus Binataceae bacterium]|nr:6,7-dimethyl-8-ribityllumazine synthase [Candidatus Binataceae bacterium]